MKLVAMWVKSYMRIEDQGFNLGSKYTYRFKFNPYKNELRIKARDTEDYFQLFEDEGITNITGIVGVNGAGKTSILKLINVLANEQPLYDPVVLVFEDSVNDSIEIVNYNNVRGANDIKLSFENTDINSKLSNTSNPFSETNVIFYSNLSSEQNDKYLKLNDHLNRSVDYQTRTSLSPEVVEISLKDYKKSIVNRTLFAEASFDILRPYYDDKRKRLIKMLAEINSKHIKLKSILTKIRFPRDITIWFNDNIFKESEKLIEKSIYDFEVLAKLHNHCVAVNNKVQDSKTKLKNEVIYKSFFIAFYNDYLNQSDNKLFLENFEEYVKAIKLNNLVFETLKKFLKSQDSENKSLEISKINSLINKIDELVEGLLISGHSSTMERHFSYTVRINDQSWELLSNLLSVSDYSEEYMFHYALNPFSAGESALLNQFSELYESLSYLDKKNVIVTIDEGELYMHPEWQRQYVDSIFQFFKYFNHELELDKNIQIILTSHSPFIASDIPKHNLIFLQRDENDNCMVSESLVHKPTFGGNIFELFNDSFFVQDFISDFAFKKMNEAFKFLKGEKSEFKSLNDVDTFNSLIGEPIIREELQKLIDRSKNENFDKFYEVIKHNELNNNNNNKLD